MTPAFTSLTRNSFSLDMLWVQDCRGHRDTAHKWHNMMGTDTHVVQKGQHVSLKEVGFRMMMVMWASHSVHSRGVQTVGSYFRQAANKNVLLERTGVQLPAWVPFAVCHSPSLCPCFLSFSSVLLSIKPLNAKKHFNKKKVLLCCKVVFCNWLWGLHCARDSQKAVQTGEYEVVALTKNNDQCVAMVCCLPW